MIDVMHWKSREKHVLRSASTVLKVHTHRAASRRCWCGLGATRRGRLWSLTAAYLELEIN
jgi:hypothetical protein